MTAEILREKHTSAVIDRRYSNSAVPNTNWYQSSFRSPFTTRIWMAVWYCAFQ